LVYTYLYNKYIKTKTPGGAVLIIMLGAFIAPLEQYSALPLVSYHTKVTYQS